VEMQEQLETLGLSTLGEKEAKEYMAKAEKQKQDRLAKAEKQIAKKTATATIPIPNQPMPQLKKPVA